MSCTEGGLVGSNYSGNINNSYAAGSLNGTSNVGGLVGYSSYGTIANSYFDQTKNPGLNPIGTNSGTSISNVAGKTTTEMMQASTFTGWNISNTGGSSAVWRIYEGNTYPLLRSFLTPLTLSDTTVSYTSNPQYGIVARGLLGSAAMGTDPGFYNNNYFSSQQGFDIMGGNLVITPDNPVVISSIITTTLQTETPPPPLSTEQSGTGTINLIEPAVLDITSDFAGNAVSSPSPGSNPLITVLPIQETANRLFNRFSPFKTVPEESSSCS